MGPEQTGFRFQKYKIQPVYPMKLTVNIGVVFDCLYKSAAIVLMRSLRGNSVTNPIAHVLKAADDEPSENRGLSVCLKAKDFFLLRESHEQNWIDERLFAAIAGNAGTNSAHA
ncbi:hypothetical protein GCM10028803_05450 [Larkinella knui]|uniref:Uncharacterized protein n=2 Tax=Larkinella knui TaxID=2025310 RepID=A0A3P1CKJ3_9BACT|nr:hypothetical protein EHT87_16085 [Larkinella knui]